MYGIYGYIIGRKNEEKGSNTTTTTKPEKESRVFSLVSSRESGPISHLFLSFSFVGFSLSLFLLLFPPQNNNKVEEMMKMMMMRVEEERRRRRKKREPKAVYMEERKFFLNGKKDEKWATRSSPRFVSKKKTPKF